MKKNLEEAYEDPPAEVDFAGATRGKHIGSREGEHTVEISRVDGTTLVQTFALEEGTVHLDPDVRRYFPDSQSVNRALRTLISLVPKPGTAASH